MEVVPSKVWFVTGASREYERRVAVGEEYRRLAEEAQGGELVR